MVAKGLSHRTVATARLVALVVWREHVVAVLLAPMVVTEEGIEAAVSWSVLLTLETEVPLEEENTVVVVMVAAAAAAIMMLVYEGGGTCDAERGRGDAKLSRGHLADRVGVEAILRQDGREHRVVEHHTTLVRRVTVVPEPEGVPGDGGVGEVGGAQRYERSMRARSGRAVS